MEQRKEIGNETGKEMRKAINLNVELQSLMGKSQMNLLIFHLKKRTWGKAIKC